jgi:hypothetical protein
MVFNKGSSLDTGFPATQNSRTSTCAAFVKESRMKFAKAININRKSGEAQCRDLRFPFPALTHALKPLPLY